MSIEKLERLKMEADFFKLAKLTQMIDNLLKNKYEEREQMEKERKNLKLILLHNKRLELDQLTITAKHEKLERTCENLQSLRQLFERQKTLAENNDKALKEAMLETQVKLKDMEESIAELATDCKEICDVREENKKIQERMELLEKDFKDNQDKINEQIQDNSNAIENIIAESKLDSKNDFINTILLVSILVLLLIRACSLPDWNTEKNDYQPKIQTPPKIEIIEENQISSSVHSKIVLLFLLLVLFKYVLKSFWKTFKIFNHVVAIRLHDRDGKLVLGAFSVNKLQFRGLEENDPSNDIVLDAFGDDADFERLGDVVFVVDKEVLGDRRDEVEKLGKKVEANVYNYIVIADEIHDEGKLVLPIA